MRTRLALVALICWLIPAVTTGAQGNESEGELGILFYSTRNDEPGLYWMRADGGNVHLIVSYAEASVHKGAYIKMMSLSPDGGLLALVLVESLNDATAQERGDLYLLDMQTKELSRLTHGRDLSSIPIWSRDGKRVAFLSDSGTSVSAVEVGSGKLQLVANGESLQPPGALFYVSGFFEDVAWSPNSEQLVLSVSIADVVTEFGFLYFGTSYTVKADGSDFFMVFNGQEIGGQPAERVYSVVWSQPDTITYVCSTATESPKAICDQGIADIRPEVQEFDFEFDSVTDFSGLAGDDISALDISPSGQMAFSVSLTRPNTYERADDIYVFDPLAQQLVNLTADTDSYNNNPVWFYRRKAQ